MAGHLREEQKMHADFRRAELRQDASINKAELTLKEAERVQALRAREVELYSRVMESKTRKVALDKGAGTVLADLEHELARNKAHRVGEQADWEHVRHLAQIRMRTELEVLQQTGRRTAPTGAAAPVAPAAPAGDREPDRASAADRGRIAPPRGAHRLAPAREGRKARELQIEAEAHAARIHGMTMASQRRREAERVQEWEDQLALARQRELLREDAVKDAANAVQVARSTRRSKTSSAPARRPMPWQHENCCAIEADGIHAPEPGQRQTGGPDQLAVEEQRLILRQREQKPRGSIEEVRAGTRGGIQPAAIAAGSRDPPHGHQPPERPGDCRRCRAVERGSGGADHECRFRAACRRSRSRRWRRWWRRNTACRRWKQPDG
jgi:hypothetical protein